jgi:hypothetical protein
VGVNLLPDVIHSPQAAGTWLGHWYTQYLRPTTQADYRPGVWGSDIIYNQSLAGAGNRWLGTTWRYTNQGIDITEISGAPSAALLKGIVYGSEGCLLLFVTVLLVVASRSGGSEDTAVSVPSQPALEYSSVVCLMVLLSPMSSIPHFCTLLLPGYCAARLAVQGRSGLSWFLVIAGFALATLSNKDLQGARLYTLCLWHGVVTWNTLVLLGACLLGLARIDKVRREQRIHTSANGALDREEGRAA